MSGTGRRRIVETAEPLLADVTGKDGEIDIAALRQAANAGFGAAPEIPLSDFGVEIDSADAARFFDGL